MLVVAASPLGCRDVGRFSSHDDHYEGDVVSGSFVRSGFADGVRFCLTLDTDHLQDGPGALSTSDGRFARAPLRPIPQVWHDPLSTMTFGEGRVQNLLYAVRPTSDGGGGDVMVVLSLMQGGDVELRLVRGAPSMDDAGTSTGGENLFSVAALERQKGPCTY